MIKIMVVLLLIGILWTNSQILIKIQNFSFTKMHRKTPSAKWQPFCLGGDELNKHYVAWQMNDREAQICSSGKRIWKLIVAWIKLLTNISKLGFVFKILHMFIKILSGPLFTKRTDVLPQDLVKSRTREIGYYNDRIAFKFDRHIERAVVEEPVKFQSDWKSLNPNLAASRLHEIWW